MKTYSEAELRELEKKAKQYDEIATIIDDCYADDSEDDLCTIGEKICSYFGYL